MTDQTAAAAESFNFWRPKVIHDFQAWALVGCEAGETSFILHPVGDHGEAVGAFQWHEARAAAILKATSINVQTASHLDQLAAAAWEMTKEPGYARVLANLNATTDVTAAETVLVTQFERSASPATDIPKRVGYARLWCLKVTGMALVESVAAQEAASSM